MEAEVEVSTETEERLAAEQLAAARRAEQLAAIRADEQRKAAEAAAQSERQAQLAARQAAELEYARKVQQQSEAAGCLMCFENGHHVMRVHVAAVIVAARAMLGAGGCCVRHSGAARCRPRRRRCQRSRRRVRPTRW